MNQRKVTFFELDQPDVQAHKLETLANSNRSCYHVYFVSVDFTRDSIFEKLTETGYDPAKKTLFLWEGVTLYLSETEVRKIMRSVRAQAFKDSILLPDIYAIRMLLLVRALLAST